MGFGDSQSGQSGNRGGFRSSQGFGGARGNSRGSGMI